ncbi:glutamate receptor ionotropic, delta-1 [Rhagoletis pomonella]|uniref:glutamate receptor ionotropic, delta-1 n=1 Tax=Rhagoletis pomonella TaxID=28610 RepID=UPI00177EB22A|nr:glutamate receptor ionotropic, delta-1 [Rhagoletis pomonella]
MDIILRDLGRVEWERTGNYTLILAIAWTILNVYAKYPSTTLIISQYASELQSNLHQAELIDALMVYLEKRHHHVYIMEQEKMFDDVDRSEWGDISDTAIWFIDSWNSFGALAKDLDHPQSAYQRSGWFLIVYTGTEPERLETVKNIFSRLFELFFVNVNVFLLMDATPFVYTYFPFSRTKCHSAKPELLMSFRNKRPRYIHKSHRRFFPPKVNNLHGCELGVITWHDPPFIILKTVDETGHIVSIDGIEGMLISLLSEAMNFGIRIVDPQPHDRGAIYANGTLTGVTRMIVEGEGNISIIYFMYEKKRAQIMDASCSYMAFPLLVAIPPGRPISPLQRLFRPFKYIIWSLIGSNLVLAVLIIYALKLFGSKRVVSFVFGKANRFPFSNLWASLYGGGVIHNHLPYRNFSRYLLGLWLLCTLVLRSAYTGQLFIMLQDGRALTPLKTFQEIFEKKFVVNTAPVLAELLTSVMGNVAVVNIDGGNNSMPMILKRIARGSKEILSIIEPAVMYYNYQQETEDERVAILPQKLIMTPLTMYMRKHSYLTIPINAKLLDFIDLGIINKFENRYRLPDSGEVSQEPVQLSLFLLTGIFGVYLVLMGFCTLVFLLELWTTRSPLAKMAIDFLNYYWKGQLIFFEYILKESRRNVAFIGPSDFLYNYMHAEKKHAFFKILKQKVLNLHTTIYLTKHSYLIDEFQNQILWVQAAGLIDAWARWELYDDKKDLSGFGEDDMQQAKELYVLIIIGTYEGKMG